MPRFNVCLILFAILIYLLTAGVTLRDRLLISTLHRIERNAYFEPSAKELFEGAMSGMTDVLSDEHGDGYTMYIPPSEQVTYQNRNDNRSEGLGFLLRTHQEGEEQKHFIAFPFLESPANRAGLRSGDQILQINDTSVTDKTSDNVLGLLQQHRDAGLLLTVLPFGQMEPQEIFVQAEKYHRGSVMGNYFDLDKQVFCLETHPKIGYIWITTFGGTTAKEFGDALEQMTQSGVESFILDLRDNPGGDVWNCVQIVKMLIPPGDHRDIIVTSRNRNGQERSFTLKEREQRTALPMVVLINGDTASSSEIIAAALQDHKRAAVVGTRSFGKGIIQGIFDLPFQSGMIQLTDAEYRRPNGAAIHRKKDSTDSDDWGVIPDHIVELSEAEQSAVTQYRLLRSKVISTERSAALDLFRQQIVENQSDEGGKPFEFTGAAPYYDLQLDEAIKIISAAQ